MGKPLFLSFKGHVGQITKGIGVGKRAVLAPAFDIVGPLFVIGPPAVPVGTGENPALTVNLYVEGVVAAPFGKNLKNLCFGMVSPDGLALEGNVFGCRRTDISSGG